MPCLCEEVIPILGIYPQETPAFMHKDTRAQDVQRRTVCNSKKAGTIYMTLRREKDK